MSGTWRGSNPGLTPPPGLLRLEELVRGFLISKETLSVRMLDDSRDPTPLLKEIRDDKVSTIIIDANASISHLILRKVGPLSLLPYGVRGRNMGDRAHGLVPIGLGGHMGYGDLLPACRDNQEDCPSAQLFPSCSPRWTLDSCRPSLRTAAASVGCSEG